MMTGLLDEKRTLFAGLILVGLLSLVGCTAPQSDICSTGIVCPIGTTCSSDGQTCVKEGCGNSEVDTGELCDDGNNESGDGCSADCLSEERCGDGYTDESIGEACDDGNTAGGDGCNADCSVLEQCGDGIVSEGEACDDGNENDLDDCNKSCSSDNSCGNGIIDFNVGERCDPGLTPDECNADCTSNLACGNGLVDPGEECDDGEADEETPGGNGDNSDDCITTDQFACQAAECGDGFVRENPENPDDAEECDDGEETEDCNSDCTLSECGDGVINASSGEICDDGELNGEQGRCGTDCQSELSCGDGIRTLPELCDGPRDTDPAECNETCDGFAPYCGDGNQDDGEECDFGESNSNDEYNGCTRACTLGPYCGDTQVNGLLEQCDDPNGNVAAPGHANSLEDAQCSLACTIGPYCGDGTLQPENEDCDGNQSVQGPLASSVICYEGCQGYCGDGNGDGATNDPADSDAPNFEGCDDGPLTYDSDGDPSGGNGYNTTNGGCRTNCTRCGDGAEQRANFEFCDNGDANVAPGYYFTETCSNQCTVNPFCGDGNTDTGDEVCDPNDPDVENCEESCLWGVGASCTVPQQCDSGVCVAGFCRIGIGGVCEQTSDCAVGVCDDGTCLLNNGSACNDDNECSSGLCNPGKNVCAPTGECRNGRLERWRGEACDDGNDANGDACSNDCDLGLGQTGCSSNNDDCESNLCQNNRCVNGLEGSCSTETDCGNNLTCNGSDVCKLEDGVQCTYDSACESTLCKPWPADPRTCVDRGICGNGVEDQPSEGCDDGNTNDADSCNNSCRLSLGESCDAGLDCQSSLCESTCVSGLGGPCGSDDCAAGFACWNGSICRYENGTNCNSDDQCASGFCDDEGDDATDQCQAP